MKQQILNLGCKRRYLEIQNNPSALLSHDQLEQLNKKFKQEINNECVSLFLDDQNDLQFEDLININEDNYFNSEQAIELFDERQEIIMDIKSEKQLNQALANQKHLNAEQKIIFQRRYYERLQDYDDENQEQPLFDKIQQMLNIQTDTQSENNEHQYLSEDLENFYNEMSYYQLEQDDSYQRDIIVGQCQDSEVEIIKIGYLDGNSSNQSFELESIHYESISYDLNSNHQSIESKKQANEKPLLNQCVQIENKFNLEKAKPCMLFIKKIRKRKQPKQNQKSALQKNFFTIIQQFPQQKKQIIDQNLKYKLNRPTYIHTAYGKSKHKELEFIE